MATEIRMGKEGKRVKLIILEGIDGCGKTTVAKQLTKDMIDKKEKTALFVSKKSIDAKTEFQSEIMRFIRNILWERSASEPLDEIDESSWMYLHLLWYHAVETFVLPNYSNYDYIIMDGWFYKALSRNLVNNKNDVEYTQNLFKRVIPGDVVVLLKVKPEICCKRKGNLKPSECGQHLTGHPDTSAAAFISYQNRVEDAYLKLSDIFPMIMIDADRNIEELSDKILEII
jgi:thymidylate kinase